MSDPSDKEMLDFLEKTKWECLYFFKTDWCVMDQDGFTRGRSNRSIREAICIAMLSQPITPSLLNQ